ncbi:MAG: AAA family ATPase [Rhodospirillaceae bacterium]|nr:AAA family ATPase [Rhodospirillaceae bacterium]MBT4486175.1 AAA family ATPase [Rhodospirillaceae bacterium]
MDLAKELDIYLRARFALIHVVSREEERVVAELNALCQKSGRALFVWDIADHFRKLVGDGPEPQPAKDPLSALDAIEKMDGECVFLLPDFHQCWKAQSVVVRKLRNLTHKLKYTRKSLIISSPSSDIPEELKDDIVVLDFPPPGYDELSAILGHLEKTPGVKFDLDDDLRDRMVSLALGLSLSQAQRVFSKAIVTGGVLDETDLTIIATEKQQIIRESGALEYYTASETINDVGGLELLKDWLARRQLAFREDAQAYGLSAPKGIALIGIPGTGKSLSAKMVANLWHLPLIRLDIGAMFGGLVGESEENARTALRLAEAVAPCVLWIDELEKALSTGDGDSGTSMRVFGTLLSWMQDKKKPVFIVATANDITKLPPELLRRGRFDEIFFLDLPNPTERRAIFDVHLKKRGRDPENFDLGRLAAASGGYVGAEIEQAVIDAMYLAFSDEASPGREFTDDDIRTALERLVPMSRSQRERIDFLRTWVEDGRAASASLPEEAEQSDGPSPLQITPLDFSSDSANS